MSLTSRERKDETNAVFHLLCVIIFLILYKLSMMGFPQYRWIISHWKLKKHVQFLQSKLILAEFFFDILLFFNI